MLMFLSGVENLDDKQIRRRYLKGNWAILLNCTSKVKIDESERNQNGLPTKCMRKTKLFADKLNFVGRKFFKSILQNLFNSKLSCNIRIRHFMFI